MVLPLLDMPGGWEWLIILAIVVLIFGAAKLPDLARGSGQALRIFKAEARGLKEDEARAKTPAGPSDAVASPAELEAKKADLDARQAELDAERAKLGGDA